MSKRVSRRRFLRASAGAFAVPLILPSGLLAAPGRPGPNDQINIAHIGVGRRARQLMRMPQGARMTAIADVNRARLDALTARPEGKHWKAYQDYREMLEDPSIDAVVVASPDHWHTLHTIHACQAGKDVYVEKPITLTVREGRQMVEAARTYERIVQAGSQQRAMSKNRFACELVRNGRIGQVHTVHASNFPSPWECDLPEQPVPDGLDWDAWCGQTEPRPYHEELYLPRVRGHEAGWISYRPYSGGEMTGWGTHGLDQIQWALGMDESGPLAIWPHPDEEPPDDGVHKGPRCPVTFRFPGGVLVKLDDKGKGGGGLFVGDGGTIDIDRDSFTASQGVDLTSIPPSGVQLYRSEDKAVPYTGGDTEKHIANWVYCIRTREKPATDVEVAHRSTTLCHLGNIARWVGRELNWDAQAERFIDDDEADALLERTQRAPYSIPEPI